MATFKTRVQEYLGTNVTATSDAEVTQALTDSASDIINIMPRKAEWIMTQTTGHILVNNYALLPNARILGVERDHIHCKRMPHHFKHNLTDSNSLFAPSSEDPVFIVDHGTVSVYPTQFDDWEIMYIPYPQVNFDDTSINMIELTGVTVTTGGLFTKANHNLSVGDSVILTGWSADDGDPADFTELNSLSTQVATTPLSSTFTLEGISSVTETATGKARKGVNFPREAEHLIPLGASVKLMGRVLTDKRETMNDMIPPSCGLLSAPDIGDADISSLILPAPPTVFITNDFVIDPGDATNVDGNPPEIDPVTIAKVTALSDVSYGTLPAPPTYTAPTLDISNEIASANNYITTNEDIELAGSKLEVIKNKIGAFQGDLTNSLQVFQGQAAQYKAEVEKVTYEYTEELKFEMQNKQSELSENMKQAEVDLGRAMEKAKTAGSIELANKQMENAKLMHNNKMKRQIALQNSIETLKASISNAQIQVSKYSADLVRYKEEVTANLTTHQINEKKTLNNWVNTEKNKVAKYQIDTTKHTTEIGRISKQIEVMTHEWTGLQKLLETSLGMFLSKYGRPSKASDQKSMEQREMQRQKQGGQDSHQGHDH